MEMIPSSQLGFLRGVFLANRLAPKQRQLNQDRTCTNRN